MENSSSMRKARMTKTKQKNKDSPDHGVSLWRSRGWERMAKKQSPGTIQLRSSHVEDSPYKKSILI